MMKFEIYVALLFTILQIKNFAFGNNYCTYSKTCYATAYTSCGFLWWKRCGYRTSYTCYYLACCRGWTGSQCKTPICSTACINGGTCIAPDHCKCPSSHTGEHCTISLCSHVKPCYPGTCSYPGTCTCFHGFTDSGKGCLSFSGDNNPPTISACEITLARIRRTDQKQLFFYNIPCSDSTGTDTVWCNQELFNYANFSMKSHYEKIPNLPPAPAYVTSHSFGIVDSWLNVKHTKYPRPGDNSRHIAFNTNYKCKGFSDYSPKTAEASCEIVEQNYVINIEHDDFFTVVYSTKTGGYRDLYDRDHRRPYAKQNYTGQTLTKSIVFKFDFIAPTHCSEKIAKISCLHGEQPIGIGKDITKDPIRISWDGWTDTLSGIASYYVEVFKLEPNIHGDLTELEPLKPIYTFTTNRTSSINFPTYYPPQTGMYSILLQASDKANNSKIARRLVLYDNDSIITLTKPGFRPGKPINVSEMTIGDGGMHVTSAIKDTGYMWQTSKNGTKTHIVVNWENHFVNKIYDTGKLLNRVLKYPTQFAEFQDDGILRSKKYVNLTDNEGARTLSAIPNKHGIVKFEINRVFTDDRQVPKDNWIPHDLTEQYEIEELLSDGSHVRLWVRATDVMNHTVADYTEVHIDNTQPRVADTKLQKNVQNGTFTHTSRITFTASDDGSGVHRLSYKLFVGNNTDVQYSGFIPSNRNNDSDACAKDPDCNCVLHTCFLPPQMMDIDNCWFLVPKEDLNKSGRVEVTVYNQALLGYSFTVNITRLTDLRGLEEYSGPTNIRVEKNIASGVRLVWDLPKTASCYGRADIEVVLVNADGSIRVVKVYSEGTSVDLVGLNPDQDYKISLNLGYRGTELAALPFSFKTAPRENYLSGGVIAGIVISVLVIFGIMIAIFVVLLRRGHMQPVRRGLRAMTVKYRKSVAGFGTRARNNDYQTRNTNTDSLYMYGEMDFKDIQKWQMGRDDVVFESLLKSGGFADIYLAKLRSSNETVIAKTLKQNYKENDEFLMKAKINFSSIEVGQHENVLRFVGAVVADSDIGPFIVYEYCSNGPLRDYLESMRNGVTLETQEQLLRFGLGVAKGMEYLVQRKIVHRRLAARNILLDSELVPKISGFGPQPEERKDDDGQAKKRERIPMKWVAPECLKSTADATEKSDVWSFGIVLWEIFSFGESPYGNIRGRDLPSKLKGGYRLPKPEQCDDKWYGVMKQAWSEDPKKRPSFKEIRNVIDEEFVSAQTDEYYYYRK